MATLTMSKVSSWYWCETLNHTANNWSYCLEKMNRNEATLSTCTSPVVKI